MIKSKGFTLIELIIVIAIISILATTVVLVLNPAELLAKARDSQRLTDLGTIQSAISLTLATATNTSNIFNDPGPLITLPNAAPCGFGSTNCRAATSTTLRAIDGSGWVSFDFTRNSGGPAITNLPIDPLNSGNYFYAYMANKSFGTYELNARLESEAERGKMETDGGDNSNCTATGGDKDYTLNTCWYEVGSDPGLDL